MEPYNGVDNITEYWAILVAPLDYQSNPDSFIQHAEMIKYVLRDHGWKQDHINFLAGTEATKLNLSEAFSWLNNHEDEDDVVVLFLLSHGGEGFFCLHGFGDITYEELDEEIDQLDSANIGVIISACHSGSAIPELSQDGRIIVTACEADSSCGGMEDEYITGIQEFSDYFGNNNGKVSVEEMFNSFIEYEYNGWTPQIDDNIPGELEIINIDESDHNPDQIQTRIKPDLFYELIPESGTFLAQSFKPSFNKINRVKLFVGKYQNPAPFIVSIRNELTGEDLTSVKVTVDSMFTWDWYRSYIPPNLAYDFYFPEIDVIPGETYYIVCRPEEIIYQNHYYVRNAVSDNGSAYEDGCLYYNDDGGEWICNESADLCFATFYDENHPPTIKHKAITQIPIGSDFEITAEIRDDVSLPQDIKAFIEYRPSDCLSIHSPDGHWLTVEMKYIGGNPAEITHEEGLHKGIIPARDIQRIYERHGPDCAMLEYRIKSTDEAGNENITQIYRVTIIGPDIVPHTSAHKSELETRARVLK